MLYQFAWNQEEQRWNLHLQRVFPTTHSAVMSAILYQTPPDKSRFEEKIIKRIQAGNVLSGVPVLEGVGEVALEDEDADRMADEE